MKNTTKDNLLSYIRGPFRSAHGLSSAATTWLGVELGLQNINTKVRFWLGSTGPTDKAKAALVALRNTSDEDIAAALATEAAKNEQARIADEAKREQEQREWGAKLAAMTTQEREDFMADAQCYADEVEREEEHGSTKTLPRGWSVSSDGRTLNQFGDEA